MRTYTIRYSTIVAAAIVAVVYSASVQHCKEKRRDLLRHIEHEAEHLLAKEQDKEILNEWLPEIINGPCKKDVFCLAEKALKLFDQSNTTFHDDKKLERFLAQYNNMTIGTNCTLNEKRKCQLRTFLKELKKCAGHAYNSTG